MKPFNKSPFILANTEEYQQWRKLKLKQAHTSNIKSVINLSKTPHHFSKYSQNKNTQKNTYKDNLSFNERAEIDSIIDECNIDNYCLYSIEDYKRYDINVTKLIVNLLAKECGLIRLDNNICSDDDGLTSICISDHKGQHEYIPYTNKKLNWHTDGYYNLPEKTIYSMLLHCFHAANNGGESAFMDHEIAYILLRDENPKWIDALNNNTVMTIPANILNGKIIRPEQTGPVFSLSPQGRLHMRYSARQRNIIWKKDKATLDAIEFLQNLLNDNTGTNKGHGSEYITRHKFKAGEGIISRNILHCRTSFDVNELHDEQRLLFRGRYYDEL